MKTILLSMFISFFSSSLFAEILVENAWVKNAPPVAPVRAAYFTLINTSNEDVIIQKIASPQFNQVEAHETIYNNSTYSMRPIETLTIAPNSSFNSNQKANI